jgi:hypothetical protein
MNLFFLRLGIIGLLPHAWVANVNYRPTAAAAAAAAAEEDETMAREEEMRHVSSKTDIATAAY